jgi:hypothetical protein
VLPFKTCQSFKTFNPPPSFSPRRGGGKHVLSNVEGRWGSNQEFKIPKSGRNKIDPLHEYRGQISENVERR